MSKIHVVIAGGRTLFREGLRSLLEREQQLAVIGEADDVRNVPRLLSALSAHVVLLNLTPSNVHDIDLVRSIVRADPRTRLVLLTLSPPIDYVQELMNAGAKACLNKECPGSELLAAIEKVMAGGVHLSPALVEHVVSRYATPPRLEGGRRLAPREREVLRLIAAGYSAKEIAAAMSISLKTVDTHRRRMMQKIDCHTIAALTKYAVVEGLAHLETSH